MSFILYYTLQYKILKIKDIYVKKAEQRINAFELWCWISLEGMMLKLKLQYFGHLMQELTHWKRL